MDNGFDKTSGNHMVDGTESTIKEGYECTGCGSDKPGAHWCNLCGVDTDEQECHEYHGLCADCATTCEACGRLNEECQCPDKKENI